jgi:hypothetical protein
MKSWAIARRGAGRGGGGGVRERNVQRALRGRHREARARGAGCELSGGVGRGPHHARAMLSRRAGSQVGACVREHTGGIGALARVRERTQRTCGSFALYGPAGRTPSILDLRQHWPALSNCSC